MQDISELPAARVRWSAMHVKRPPIAAIASIRGLLPALPRARMLHHFLAVQSYILHFRLC